MTDMNKERPSPTQKLIGQRRTSSDIDPVIELQRAKILLEEFSLRKPFATSSLGELKQCYAEVCRSYYTIAAISRRRVLEDVVRNEILRLLYPMRSRIERAILADMSVVKDCSQIFTEATSRSFFGFSSKQGVSIRYPLSVCAPTLECGGRCYAHDGRDRELHLIFRGVLNLYCGLLFESGSASEREEILRELTPTIRYAVKKSIDEARIAADIRFAREPRIRFAQVGEMTATPEFTNALAGEIKKMEPKVACVIYTRHPDAKKLNPQLFRVNFTLDRADDRRRDLAPYFARIVSSAWDGKVSSDVDVNFLEHHVEKAAPIQGNGFACPVTVNHSSKPSCDVARCDICFRERADLSVTNPARQKDSSGPGSSARVIIVKYR